MSQPRSSRRVYRQPDKEDMDTYVAWLAMHIGIPCRLVLAVDFRNTIVDDKMVRATGPGPGVMTAINPDMCRQEIEAFSEGWDMASYDDDEYHWPEGEFRPL